MKTLKLLKARYKELIAGTEKISEDIVKQFEQDVENYKAMHPDWTNDVKGHTQTEKVNKAYRISASLSDYIKENL